MVVIYAEKPGMARLFAAALGGIEMNNRTVSFSELSKNEKEIERFQRNQGFLKTTFQGKPYIITWGYGHLCELKDIKDYDSRLTKWKNIPLPYIPESYQYKVKESSRRQYDIVSRLFNDNNVEYIVNATDDDREGEAIFCYTYELSGSSVQTYRAILNKQTQNEIIRAFSELSEKRVNIENAARARGIADWQIGISMTIRATLQYGEFGDTYNIGRVMTPTLNLIVEREKQIASFKSNVSYAVKAQLTTADGSVFTSEYEEKFPTREAAETFVKKLDTYTCVVSGIENKKISEAAPFPFSLDTLQKAANETFGMTASDTLAAAQKVYEGYGAGGSLSYPRTDASHYTEDMKSEIPKYIQNLSRLPEYAGFISKLDAISIPKKYFDDKKVDSHAALSVTEILPPYQKLAANEKNIYDLVARSVIMLAYPDFKYIRTRVTLSVSGYDFVAKGRRITEAGWTELKIQKKKQKTNPEDKQLPELKKGDTPSAVMEISQTKTQKPSRYTDSSLLTAMKNCGRNVEDEDYAKILSAIDGIGRPSTRAATIEKLVRTQYVTRRKNHLIPTQKAMLLMDRLPVDDLKTPELTAHWETVLDKIAKGTASADEFIKDVQDKSREWCHRIYGDKIALTKDENGDVDIVSSAKKPVKFPDSAYGHVFTDEEKQNLLDGDTYYFSKLVSKKGTVFSAWVQYAGNELKYFKYNPFLEAAAVCPKCHSKMFPGANGDILCPSGCVDIPAQVADKRLTVQNQYDLLTAGITSAINGFISRKTGQPFSARLVLNPEFRIVYDFNFKEPEKIQKAVFYTPPSLIGKHYHEVWD
jgi:DNA topoisomerase-3